MKKEMVMSKAVRTRNLRSGMQVFVTLVVFGLFIAACGSEKTTTTTTTTTTFFCPNGYMVCATAQKCCPSGTPYLCSDGKSCSTTNSPCPSGTHVVETCI